MRVLSDSIIVWSHGLLSAQYRQYYGTLPVAVNVISELSHVWSVDRCSFGHALYVTFIRWNTEAHSHTYILINWRHHLRHQSVRTLSVVQSQHLCETSASRDLRVYDAIVLLLCRFSSRCRWNLWTNDRANIALTSTSKYVRPTQINKARILYTVLILYLLMNLRSVNDACLQIS